MSAKRLIWGLTTASLLATASAGSMTAQAGKTAPAGKHDNHFSVKRPLVEAVRQATERFRDVNDALAAGYVQNGGCVSGPEQGAMGVHFAKPPLFDGTVDVEQPEVLVYEPRNGRLHLVAAEYVVPAPAWDPVHDPFDKPHLMGHMYHFVPANNRYGPEPFYELHVWAWKDNPHGSFADWNPRATCVEWDGSTP
jgi:hypothetical protein